MYWVTGLCVHYFMLLVCLMCLMCLCVVQVKDIYVYPELFSVENGLLTPTFKAKRTELMRYFGNQLKRMYDEMPRV